MGFPDLGIRVLGSRGWHEEFGVEGLGFQVRHSGSSHGAAGWPAFWRILYFPECPPMLSPCSLHLS